MTDGVQSASCRTISKKVEKGESLIWHSADDKWQDWCLRTPTDAHGLGAKNERARSWPQKRLNKALPPHLIKDWFHFECAISHKNVSSIYALMDLILPLLFVIFLWRILIRNAWLNRDMALGQYSMEIIDNNFAWFLTSSARLSLAEIPNNSALQPNAKVDRPYTFQKFDCCLGPYNPLRST